MITKFDTLYTGHVDMENPGYGGTPVMSRDYPNEVLVTVFDKAETIAKAVDRLGYESFWAAEHHFQPEGYECIPNLLMLYVHLAHVTERIKLGCGFNITPMWHPLRLAEDFATADILTGGRVIFGVGRGYHTREVETFGSPLLDQDANRELFEEQVEIILLALRERRFSHHGKYYDLPPKVDYRGNDLEDLTLVPRPTHPFECWQPIQGGSQRGLDFMVKHGIKGMLGGGVAASGIMRPVVEGWQQAYARAGRETQLGEDLSVGFHFYIADSREEAIRFLGPYHEENVKMFGPLRLLRSLSEEQIENLKDPATALADSSLPKLDEAVAQGSVLAGTPDQIIERLRQLEEEFPGLERVTLGHPSGISDAVIVEQFERFAAEIMPAFSGRAEAVATSP
jgi:alkanesulfonate monooxygenase SsuD/methylene tetrahydromethanopterin reductase-like flavin-dependent oxidoreductase (luciferase family)